MVDDMGYSDIGCYGGEIETPNLDQLADEGLRFTNFYSQNMCVVSRACLLTGVWHKASKLKKGLHPRCFTIAEALNASGYTTLMSGKWHLGMPTDNSAPTQRGFDQYYGIIGGAASFFAPDGLMRDLENVEHEFLDPDFYLTDTITANAVQQIEQADPTAPLFLYLAYTAAHWPLHALPEDIANYEGKYAMGWDELRQSRYQRMLALGVIDKNTPLSPRNPDVPAWEDEPHKAWQERRMEVYATQVTSMDSGVGQVLDALKRAGRFEDSLILYMTDNGGCHVEYPPTRDGSYLPKATRDGRPMTPGNLPEIMPGPEETYQSYGYGWANASNTPYRLFKQHDHEGGIHTPMIAHWPGHIARPGGLTDQVAHLIDVMPTVLEITQTSLSDEKDGGPRLKLDGRSFLPILHGQERTPHEALFFHNAHGKAIRQRDWKLVQKDKEPWELYNMKADPSELNDLADRMPERVDELKQRWEAWSAEQARRAKQK